MSRQQARRIRWGVGGVLAVMLAIGLAAWQLGWADEVKVRVLGEPEPAAQPAGAEPSGGGARGRTFYDVPQEYDAAKVEADADYYKTADPSRVWQQAARPAGRDRHEELLIIGEPFRLALPNAKLDKPLTVKARAGRPVTFTALDGGQFPANGKNSITVKAGEDGKAEVEFQTQEVGDYRVLAGSPENNGPAEFIIQCVTAGERQDIETGRHAEAYLAEQKTAEESRKKADEEVGRRIEAQRAAGRK